MKFPKVDPRRTALTLLSITVIYVLISIGLIYTPEPTFELNSASIPVDLESTGLNLEQRYEYIEEYITLRDGTKLYSNLFDAGSNTTILLLHGILASNYQFNTTAGLLREKTDANVITLDLRGHGKSEGSPGDIDYIDQYLDDLNDIINTLRKKKPNHKIVLSGHSMGGGIAMRFVMKKRTEPVDGFLLFAPALGWESPTTRKESDPNSANFSQAHIMRIIGTAMLNAIGVTAFNNKPVLFFNLQNGLPLVKYTYRSMASMSPEDATKPFKKIDVPLLVLVGEKDEVFIPNEYKNLLEINSLGQVYIIENANHNSVHHHSRSIEIIEAWLSESGLLQ